MFTVTTSTSQSGTSTSGSLNLPYAANITEGDLLFVFVSRDSTGDIFLPAGWNFMITRYPVSNSGIVIWKRADGNETGDLNIAVNSSEPTTAIMTRVHSDQSSFPLFEFINNSGGSDSPEITLPWEPVKMLFMSAIVGWSVNHQVNDYPVGYDLGQAQIRTDASNFASYTGGAVASRVAITNSENPPGFAMSAGISGLAVTIAVYDLAIVSVLPATKLLGELSQSTMKIIGDISGGASITIDSVPTPDLQTLDDQTLAFVVPASAVPDIVDVELTDTATGLVLTAVNAIEYLNLAPLVFGITPTGTGLDTPIAITITGEDFRAGATVEMDGLACTDIVIVSDTEITATAPASSEQKSATLVVTNDDAQADSINFFYMALSPVKPAQSTVNANFEVTGIRYVQ